MKNGVHFETCDFKIDMADGDTAAAPAAVQIDKELLKKVKIGTGVVKRLHKEVSYSIDLIINSKPDWRSVNNFCYRILSDTFLWK